MKKNYGVPSKESCYQFKANYHSINILYIITNIPPRRVSIQYVSKENKEPNLRTISCKKEMKQTGKGIFSFCVFTFKINLSNSDILWKDIFHKILFGNLVTVWWFLRRSFGKSSDRSGRGLGNGICSLRNNTRPSSHLLWNKALSLTKIVITNQKLGLLVARNWNHRTVKCILCWIRIFRIFNNFTVPSKTSRMCMAKDARALLFTS